mgnify:CR=1 FL=1
MLRVNHLEAVRRGLCAPLSFPARFRRLLRRFAHAAQLAADGAGAHIHAIQIIHRAQPAVYAL